MYDSILQFMENETPKMEKIISKFLDDETTSLGELVQDLEKSTQKLVKNRITETISILDEKYRESSERKKEYYIDKKCEPNTILTSCGEITYSRTYFKHRESKEYVYLADRAMGITPNMRKREEVTVKAIENASDCSYRLSGENATHTDDIISKQTVMKEIHEMEIPWIIPEVKGTD